MDKRKAIALLEQGKGGDPLADALGVENKNSIGRVVAADPDLVAAREKGHQLIRELAKTHNKTQLAKLTGWSKSAMCDLLNPKVCGQPKEEASERVNYWLRKVWRVTV